MTTIDGSNTYNNHAREIEAMLNNHTIVRSVTLSVLALVRTHSQLRNVRTEVQDRVWWPFITKSWVDMCSYGICCYTRKKIEGVTYPEHVPLINCNFSVLSTGEIKVTPRFGKISTKKNPKIFYYVSEEPNYRTGRLTSPLSRVLQSFKRLSQLSTLMLDQETRITNPCLYLEDSVSASRGNSIYEAVNSQNPDWQSTIPGLALGAQGKADQNAQIENYIGSLQEALVNTINRSRDPESSIDDLGFAHKRRKRVSDTQVPLPQGRRAVFHNPSNRTNVLPYEEWFQREVPWVFGFPLSFFENNQSRVASNYKLMETISTAALRTQADVIANMLIQVSVDIFGPEAALLNSDMTVKLDLVERSINYNDNTQNSKPKPKISSAGEVEAEV